MTSSQPKPALTVSLLLAGGFTEIESWALDIGNLSRPISVPPAPGVYAFAIGEVVQYVGVATKSLRSRLGFYVKPGPTQSTNIRLNGLIAGRISSGHEVRVLVAHPSDGHWNGFRLSGPLGLEAALIEDYDLPWNHRGSSPPVEQVAPHHKPPGAVGAKPSAINKLRPSGAEAIGKAIVAHVAGNVGATELEIAQALFGHQAVQQQVNAHCRELVRRGYLERMPTRPITYRLGRAARTA